MGRIILVVGLCFVTGCAGSVYVEPDVERADMAAPSLAAACLPAGAVAHPAVVTSGATCEAFGDTCGGLTLDDGTAVECGCGNTKNACNAGRCECQVAHAPEACEACPGRVPRFCGEPNPKTQAGCVPSGLDVGDDRVWCCDS